MTDETRCAEKACPYPRADGPLCVYHARLHNGQPEERKPQAPEADELARAKAYLLGWVN